MSWRENLVTIGNLNRIQEMKNAGMGNNAIAGMFQDYGMNVTAQQIETLSTVTPELGKKALPKKEVKQAIKVYQSFDTSDDEVLVTI